MGVLNLREFSTELTVSKELLLHFLTTCLFFNHRWLRMLGAQYWRNRQRRSVSLMTSSTLEMDSCCPLQYCHLEGPARTGDPCMPP